MGTQVFPMQGYLFMFNVEVITPLAKPGSRGDDHPNAGRSLSLLRRAAPVPVLWARPSPRASGRVLTNALYFSRFASQGSRRLRRQDPFRMRKGFGGHDEEKGNDEPETTSRRLKTY